MCWWPTHWLFIVYLKFFDMPVCIWIVEYHIYNLKHYFCYLNLIPETLTRTGFPPPPLSPKYFALSSALLGQFKMAFYLSPLVSWRWGLICESLAWYFWNIYLRLSCQEVSSSFIARQPREAVLSESYHFQKIWLRFDFCGQQVLHFVKLCSGRPSFRKLIWNTENVNVIMGYIVNTWLSSVLFFSTLPLICLMFILFPTYCSILFFFSRHIFN